MGGLEPVLVWLLGLSTGDAAAVVGLAGAGIAGAGKGVHVLWTRFRRKFVVERLSGKNEVDIAAFVDLYEQVIDARSRIDPDEMVRWIRGSSRGGDLDHTTLVCRHSGSMVGFAQLIYCGEHKLAFLSYFGVDETNGIATIHAAIALAAALRVHINKRCRGVRGVVFEVDDPEEPGIGIGEAARRKARIRRFLQLARTCKLPAGELLSPYRQPEMPADLRGSNECQMRLLLISTTRDWVPEWLGKDAFLEIVRFVYFRVYRPSYYRDEQQLVRVYDSYLADLLVELSRSCPPVVAVRRNRGSDSRNQ